MVTRIVSAVVGIIVGVSVLIIDNSYLYMAVIAFISAVGVRELIRAIKCDGNKLMCWYCIISSAAVPFAVSIDFFAPYRLPALFAYVIGLLVIMLSRHKSIKLLEAAACGSAGLFIPLSLSCIILIRYLYESGSVGIFMIVFILFSAWFGDGGAYFAGTFLGKHKLCPEISPKKTVEGLIGGFVTVGIVVTIQCLVFNLLLQHEVTMNYAILIPVSIIGSAAGVLGDLTASVIKRQYEIKDFGNLMPGHGGVLDRFDSVIFTVPFMFIVFSFVSPILQ